jgi:hypothetical protein
MHGPGPIITNVWLNPLTVEDLTQHGNSFLFEPTGAWIFNLASGVHIDQDHHNKSWLVKLSALAYMPLLDKVGVHTTTRRASWSCPHLQHCHYKKVKQRVLHFHKRLEHASIQNTIKAAKHGAWIHCQFTAQDVVNNMRNNLCLTKHNNNQA